MKKKILSMMLSIAVIFSFMPLFTVQADAFSTGSKTLLKTKTVTIKPGKTYKSPKFKMKKKMAVQVPITVTLPGKIKKSDYKYKLKYIMSVKNAKGKTKAKYTCPKTLMYDGLTGDIIYENWIYFYTGKVKKPGFSKGKYYITIKNPTKRTIKVKYSVNGYTKFATNADLKKSITLDYDDLNRYVGRIGPGLPVIKSMKSSDPDIELDWYINKSGKLYVSPWMVNNEEKEHNTTITVTLLSNKKFTFNVKVNPYIND